ncbi:conserved hypothetical protein [Ricinus communis]|uniref:Uncharacterized protein n=1 Tax=Ricinus communis TaxID=3988 RepID=B9RYS7_RICCO|nr:conserved hypothetical protein [Ricinus communis]
MDKDSQSSWIALTRMQYEITSREGRREIWELGYAPSLMGHHEMKRDGSSCRGDIDVGLFRNAASMDAE